MDMPTNELRTIAAGLILSGDYQELMNVYQRADLALPPDELQRQYGEAAFSGDEAALLAEIREAVPEALLPTEGSRTTIPIEMVELVARCAFERGNDVLALRALREADVLGAVCRRYTKFALDSLAEGNDTQAAFELRLAGLLGWAQMPAEARLEVLVGLGIDPGELAFALGGEVARGHISGTRGLPDFPAWQTYGPLFHSRCQEGTCISARPMDDSAPRAVRYLLHDPALAESALEAVEGDALRLLKALAVEVDPAWGEYVERYQAAVARLEETRRLEPDASSEAEEGAKASDAASEEFAARIREGLAGVQEALLGREGEDWRNALSEIAARHPLSVFTVCVMRAQRSEAYVVPVTDGGPAFIEALGG